MQPKNLRRSLAYETTSIFLSVNVGTVHERLYKSLRAFERYISDRHARARYVQSDVRSLEATRDKQLRATSRTDGHHYARSKHQQKPGDARAPAAFRRV